MVPLRALYIYEYVEDDYVEDEVYVFSFLKNLEFEFPPLCSTCVFLGHKNSACRVETRVTKQEPKDTHIYKPIPFLS